MGLFQRIFSPEYRRALAAEAQGDYLAAARSYALCGDGGKVVDMHLALARSAETLSARLKALRDAVAFCGEREPRRPMVLRLLAAALEERAARQGGPETASGRRDLVEAAALYEASDRWDAAARVHLALGEEERAVAAFGRAGLVERVEEILARRDELAGRRRRAEAHRRDFELHLQGGDRQAALRAIDAAIAEDPDDRAAAWRPLREALAARIIEGAAVTLGVAGRPVRVVGRLPLRIGRDRACEIRLALPSVSRIHARVVADARGGFALEDAGSRNGTRVDGLRVAGAVALRSGMRIDLAAGAALRVEAVAPGRLHLKVEGGPGEGTLVVAGEAPLPLAELGPGAPEGPSLHFSDGRPVLVSPPPLLLDGARVAGPIQLVRGDRLRVGRLDLEVPSDA